MGSNTSKNSFEPSTARSSKRRFSRSELNADDLQNIDAILKTIKKDIDNFEGLRDDPRYEQCQKILADYSQQLTVIRSSTKKSKQQKCDQLKSDIQKLFQNLEDKVKANENNLDLAAVESTSFINQSVHKKRNGSAANNAEEADGKTILALQELEEKASKLDDEIRSAVQFRDELKMIDLEKQIQTTLADLEMVRVEKHTPFQDRKIEISDYLIKLNNTLKKGKQSSYRKSGNYDKVSETPSETNTRTNNRNRQIDELQQIFGDNRSTLDRKDKRSKNANWRRDPRISRMNDIEDNAKKLEKELQTAVDLEDRKQFLILEKKIHILYTDLELVQVDKYPELNERKENIGKNLIKLNNRVHKARKNLDRASGSQSRDNGRAQTNGSQAPNATLSDISKISDDIDILELKANSLEGTKSSEEYKNIKQSANKNWYKLQDMVLDSDTSKKAKQVTQERIKALLQVLNERAKINETKIENELHELEIIKAELKKLKEFALEFSDGVKNDRYDFIDQNLRKLWANLTKIKESAEVVSTRKKEIIEDIQQTLKFLSEKVVPIEPLYAEVVHSNKTKNKKPDVVDEIKQLEETLTKHSVYMSNPDLSNIDKNELTSTLERIGNEISKHLTLLKGTQPPREIVTQVPKVEEPHSDFASKIFGKYQKINQNLEAAKNESKLEPQQKNILETSLDDTSDIISSYNRELERANKEALDRIMKIDSMAQDLKKKIENFKGTKKDKEYNDIEDTLMECVISLNLIDTKNQENLKTSKDEVMHQIRELQNVLPKKLAGNETKQLQRQTSDMSEIKALIEEAQSIKKKVDCFSGAYRNVQYIQIEDSLNHCLHKLDVLDCKNNEKIKNARDQTRAKVEQWKKILDEKSIKVENTDRTSMMHNRMSYATGPNTPYSKLETVRSDLTRVKNEMELFEGKYKDAEYERIMSSLKKCGEDISGIEDNGSVSIKTTINQYETYIADLARYFEEKLESGGF